MEKMKMDSQDTDQVKVRCTSCSEQILPNREIVLNNKTICLGCAVSSGITQTLDLEMNHKLTCTKKAGFGDDQCHYCGVMNITMMRKLGYESTLKGTWFKRTDDPKILIIYE
jgi:hypothetical protein